MQNLPIQIITINNQKVNSIDARCLHTELKSKQDFSTWIKNRLIDFQENIDFIILHKIMERDFGATKKIDYILSIETAKHIAMIERNKEGKKIRQYFIDFENNAKNTLQSLPHEQQLLLFAKELIKKDEEVKQLTCKTEKQQEVIDKYVVVGNNKNYTEVAKILHIAPHKFIDYLKDNKYIMFNRMPYQKYLVNEYFIIKTSDKGYERYLITPKGFEYFSKKMIV